MRVILLVIAMCLLSCAQKGAAQFDSTPMDGIFSAPAESCLPSSTCCCLEEGTFMIVTSGPGYVNLSGATDGGQGCFYQTSLGGQLDLTSDVRAETTIPGLNILISATYANDYSSVTILSSATQCPIILNRHQDNRPQATNVVVSPSEAFVGSQLHCNYDYVDIDGDPEVNSTVIWLSSSSNEVLFQGAVEPYIVKAEDLDADLSCQIIVRNEIDSGIVIDSANVVTVNDAVDCSEVSITAPYYSTLTCNNGTDHLSACLISCNTTADESIIVCFNGVYVGFIPDCPSPTTCVGGVVAPADTYMRGSACMDPEVPSGATCELHCIYDETVPVEVLTCGLDSLWQGSFPLCPDCSSSSFNCSDGVTTVTRDPMNECHFSECPGDTSCTNPLDIAHAELHGQGCQAGSPHGTDCDITCKFPSNPNDTYTYLARCSQGSYETFPNTAALPTCPAPSSCNGVEMEHATIAGSGCSSESAEHGTSCLITCDFSNAFATVHCDNGNYAGVFPACPPPLACNGVSVTVEPASTLSGIGCMSGSPHGEVCIVNCMHTLPPDNFATFGTLVCENGLYSGELPTCPLHPIDDDTVDPSSYSQLALLFEGTYDFDNQVTNRCLNHLDKCCCRSGLVRTSVYSKKISESNIVALSSQLIGQCDSVLANYNSNTPSRLLALNSTHAQGLEQFSNERLYIMQPTDASVDYNVDREDDAMLSWWPVTQPASCPAIKSRGMRLSKAYAPSAADWTGVYETSMQCVSSSNCCCAVGEIQVIKISVNTIAIKGQLDGSTSCAGIEGFYELFQLSDEYPTVALHSLAYNDFSVNFTATLDDGVLLFSSSLHPCVSSAYKIDATPEITSTSAPVIENSDDYYSTEAVSLREGWLGNYASDGTCPVSSDCCCSEGHFIVSEWSEDSVAADPALYNDMEYFPVTHPAGTTTVFMQSDLDGGVACLRRTWLGGPCIVHSDTFAVCEQGAFRFEAEMKKGIARDGSIYRILQFYGTAYPPECVSKVRDDIKYKDNGCMKVCSNAYYTFAFMAMWLLSTSLF